MTRISDRKQIMKVCFIIFSFILIIVSPTVPSGDVFDNEGWTTLAILLFGIILWFTEVIPAAVTSMVVIILYPLFNVITFENAAQGLGNEIIWLIIAMLMMATAVKKTKLDKRIAIHMLSLSNGRINMILLNFVLLAFLLTFIIPNAMGRLSVLLPIGLSFVKTFKYLGENFSKSVLLIITFVPYLSTLSIMTGAGGSIYSASLFDSMLGYEWSYLHWMLVLTPVTLIVLFIFWLLILWLHPVKQKKIDNLDAFLAERKEDIGRMKTSEKKLAILYSFLILLWVTKEYHQLSIPMSAVLVCIFLFVPGINVLTWKEAKEDVNWGVPILFAAGFTIAFAFQTSGVVDGVTVLVEENLRDVSKLFLPAIVMLLFIAIRVVFTNYTAMVASLLPVALTFAVGSPFNPVWLGMICVVASSTSFLFPSQSIGSMTTFALGYYSSRDMFVVGSLITLVIIVITLLAAFFYWPLVGIDIY